MHIRPIRSDDIPAVSILIQALATEFILDATPPNLADSFLRGNSPDGIKSNIEQGYVYHVADDNGVIAGVIGVRNCQHLFHLFVGKPWQGQGLSRQLWDVGRRAATDAGGAPPFTVNASNYALKAYENLGFKRTAPLSVKNGIPFNAMEWIDS